MPCRIELILPMLHFKPSITVKLASLLLLCLISFESSAQYREKGKNKSIVYSDTISLGDKFSMRGYKILDSVVNNYDVFIFGENHTYMKSNSALWVKNIKYLHEHAGVRTVMIEYGQASGWLINKYLQSGDSALFEVLNKYAFKEYSSAYKELMEYNKTLADDQKITLIGIDLERGVYSAVKVLSMLLPEDAVAHDSIDLHVESLMALASYQDQEIFTADNDDYSFDIMMEKYSLSNTLDLVMENFTNHSDKYKDLLDSNYKTFERTIEGLKDVRRWRKLEELNTTHDFVYREKYMYQNFVAAYNERGGKFYGQFGRCHSTKKMVDKNGCNWYHFKSFANRLKQSKELNLSDRILTTGILYQKDDYTLDVWKEVEKHIDSLFTHMDDNRIAIYDLKKDTSLNNFFKDDFDYLMLNTTKPSSNHPYMNEDDFGFDGEDDISVTMTYSFGQMTMDFESLNLLLPSGLGIAFKNKLNMHAIEISSRSNGLSSFFSHSYVGTIAPTKVEIPLATNRTIEWKMAGFVVRTTTFYDLLPGLKSIVIAPGFSIGYTRLSLTAAQEQNSNVPNLSTGFLGEKNISNYVNPGITYGFEGLIDLNLKAFTIGGHIGYQRDLSDKNWRSKGLVASSPETSLGSTYFAARIGFNL